MFKKETIAWSIMVLGLLVVLAGFLATPVNAVDDGAPVAQEPSPRPGWDATLTPTATLEPTATPLPTATPVPASPSEAEPEPTVAPTVTLLPETGVASSFGMMLAGFALIVLGGAIFFARSKRS